jgi:hypothetical protein
VDNTEFATKWKTDVLVQVQDESNKFKEGLSVADQVFTKSNYYIICSSLHVETEWDVMILKSDRENAAWNTR